MLVFSHQRTLAVYKIFWLGGLVGEGS